MQLVMSRNTKMGVTIKKEFVKDKYLEYFLQRETDICYDELVDRVKRLSGEIIMNIYDVLKNEDAKKEEPKQTCSFPNVLPTFSFNKQDKQTCLSPNVLPTFSFNEQPKPAFIFGNQEQIFTFKSPPSTFAFGKPTTEPKIQQPFIFPHQNGISKPVNKVGQVFDFEQTKTKPPRPYIAKKPLDTKMRQFSK